MVRLCRPPGPLGSIHFLSSTKEFSRMSDATQFAYFTRLGPLFEMAGGGPDCPEIVRYSIMLAIVTALVKNRRTPCSKLTTAAI